MSDALKSVNPLDGSRVGTTALHSPEQIEEILDRSAHGQKAWGRSLSDRIERVENLASMLEERKDDMARLATLEMGKPLAEAEAEVMKCASLCQYYAAHAEKFLAPQVIDADPSAHVFSAPRPIGTVLGVMPWNYPYWQAFRFVIPTILAGNSALLRHASNVALSAKAIEDVLRAAGVPQDVFSVIFVPQDRVEGLIEDSRIAAVSLTGGEGAGRAIGGAAGRSLKPVVLELGGCDPFIVMPDADVARAAKVAVKARFQNGGQSCIAAKRFLVHEDVMAEFEDIVVKETASLRAGDPLDSDTTIGPLAKESLVKDSQDAARDAAEKGAKILIEGKQGQGNLLSPYVVSGVTSEMKLGRDEVFGPVAAIQSFKTEDEALQIANSTDFGLGASLWTENISHAEALASRIESGLVAINGMVASHPAIPFGGIKDSGVGRELGADGLLSFTNRQSVVMSSVK